MLLQKSETTFQYRKYFVAQWECLQ